MEFHSFREGKYSFPKNLQRDHYPAHALILDLFRQNYDSKPIASSRPDVWLLHTELIKETQGT